MLRNKSATSSSSGVGKYPALAQRALDHRASNGRPAPSSLTIYDNDVDWHQQVPQLGAKANGFACGVGDLGFDHEDVVVRTVIGFAAGMRSE